MVASRRALFFWACRCQRVRKKRRARRSTNPALPTAIPILAPSERMGVGGSVRVYRRVKSWDDIVEANVELEEAADGGTSARAGVV